MKIKLLAFDLDGTIVKEDHTTITNKSLEAIDYVADKGIDFLLGKGHVAVNKGQKAVKSNYANGATVTVNGKDYSIKIIKV